MSNSVDPDETARYEPSHLVLRCLLKAIIIARGNERVNIFETIYSLVQRLVQWSTDAVLFPCWNKTNKRNNIHSYIT